MNLVDIGRVEEPRTCSGQKGHMGMRYYGDNEDEDFTGSDRESARRASKTQSSLSLAASSPLAPHPSPLTFGHGESYERRGIEDGP